MASEFLKKMPPEDKERLKKQVQSQLNDNPTGVFELTSEDIEQWAKNNTEQQNKFNNTNQKNHGK